MKRWISLLLCLVLLAALLPQMALFASAEDGYPDLTNLKVSSGGLVTWDPYPGATKYWYEVNTVVVSGTGYLYGADKTQFDFAAFLEENYAPSGTFTLNIYAESDSDTLAYSKIDWTYSNGLPFLDVPSNLRWDGYVAKWDPVPGASNGYYVGLMNATDNYQITSYTTKETEWDFTHYLQYQNTEYFFYVVALGCPNGANSGDSPPSPKIKGRFELKDYDIDTYNDNGEMWIIFDTSTAPYVDSEGNTAAYYYLEDLGGNPTYISWHKFYTRSVNITDLLYHIDASSGEYKFYAEVYCSEDFAVSKRSSTVTINYTADTTSPKVTLQGWECPNGRPEKVMIDNLTCYYYNSLYCKVGDTLNFRVYPDAHHVVTGIRFQYGDEIVEENDRILESLVLEDGASYYAIKVPDKDFKIVIDQDTVYDYLETAEINFDTSIGSIIPGGYEIESATDPFEVYIRRITSDGFGSMDWFMPEASYTFSIELRAKYWDGWYKKWAEDVSVKVNGQTVPVIDRSDSDTRITVQYECTMPAATTVKLQRFYWCKPAFNLKVSSSGVLTWDEVPGAVTYSLYNYNVTLPDVEPGVGRFDLKAYLDEQGAATGWYAISAAAMDSDSNDIGDDFVAYYYKGQDRLATPTNLTWDGYVARWDPVEGAKAYLVTLYYRDDLYDYRTEYVYEPEYDFRYDAVNAEQEYVFRVRAAGSEDHAISLYSDYSDPIRGRFYYGTITLTLSGDTLSWAPYIDTEGNKAEYYEIYMYDEDGNYSYLYTSQNLVNLRQYMEMLNKPDGKYTISIMAYNSESERLAVSEWSSDVVYNYVADSGRTTVTMNGWRYAEDSPSGVTSVYANGMRWYSYEEYTMNAGETVKLICTTEEIYELVGLKLYYDEEEHDAGVPTLGADGKYSVSFKVPSQDFQVRFCCKRILKDVPTVEGSFDETSGEYLGYDYLTVPEDAHYNIRISTIDRPDGSGSTYMKPGVEYTVELTIYAEYGYKFPDSLSLTINGKSLSVRDFNEEHTTAYADYTFRSTIEIDEIQIHGIEIPEVDKVPQDPLYLLYTQSDDPYTLDFANTRWYKIADGSWMSLDEGEAFASGETYILQIAYKNVEGCPWASTVDYTLDLTDAEKERIDHINVADAPGLPAVTKVVEIYFKPLPEPILVTNAAATIREPVAGHTPDYAPVSGNPDQYKVEVEIWKWGDKAIWSSDLFQVDETYTVKLRFTPLPGYYFDATTLFKLNGKVMTEAWDSETGCMMMEMTATRDPNAIDLVKIPIAFPVDGQHPQMEVTVPESEHYTVTFDCWYIYQGSHPRLTADDVFEAGTNYSLRVVVEAKEGYVLDNKTQYAVDGMRYIGRYGPIGYIEFQAVARVANPFVDVKVTDYFYDPVLWAVGHDPQITQGMTATTFGPTKTCTRGQIVTFLWRAKGCPEPTLTENPFTDVKDTDYWYQPVLWAVENEITAGMSKTTFGPKAGCTRGQVVTFLWRTEGKPTPTSSTNPFTDVKSSDWWFDAVLWAVENGVTQGMTATTFGPNNTCTRGQIVTFLYRAFGG